MLTQFTEFITRYLGCLSSCRITEDSNTSLPLNPAPNSLFLLWLKPLVEFLYQNSLMLLIYCHWVLLMVAQGP